MKAKQIRSIVNSLKSHPLPDPCICCVYFLLFQGAIIYVGATEDLTQRIRSHWKSEKLFD